MEPETIEIYDSFILKENHIKEIINNQYHQKHIPSKPFDIIKNMKRLNDQYGIGESCYYATLYIWYNIDKLKYEEVIKYYYYYRAIRMII